VDFEQSVAYHRLVLEACLTGLVMLQRAGRDLPASAHGTLQRMCDYVAAYTRPDGQAPLVGDADDGRIQALGTQPLGDHRYLLAIGGAMFARPDLAALAGGWRDEAFWLLGPSAARIEAEDGASSGTRSTAFPQGGVLVFRRGQTHLIADVAEVGLAGRGGHGHNDVLSFELVLEGMPLVTDCGAYVYTASAEWRNRFRSTGFHNTVQVDGEELNRFGPADDLWTLRYEAVPEAVVWRPGAGADYGAEAAVYRRIHANMHFQPTYSAGWNYSLPALLWGSDTRDYYDAAGVELFGTVRRGRWSGRLGGRVEREDSLRVNTTHFAFGKAPDFGPLAGVEEGTLAALEGSAAYSLGPGAFGIGNSLVARTDAELGEGDFHYQRLVGLLSVRRSLGPVTLAARIDAGQVWGAAPPQKLFRFGSTEGLHGYEPDEFGGSTALLARARVPIGLPPRSQRPLARIGFLLVPPLRPALVLVGESGWSRVDEDLSDELARLGARPTDGARSALGLGLSVFDDAITAEYLWPVGADAGERSGRWYVGLTEWY
jgi:hypothetical protein